MGVSSVKHMKKIYSFEGGKNGKMKRLEAKMKNFILLLYMVSGSPFFTRTCFMHNILLIHT